MRPHGSGSSGAAFATSIAPGRGIACMITAVALVSLSDGTLKWVSASYSIGQILSVRGIFALAVISVLAWRAGGWRSLRVGNGWSQALRAAFTVVAIHMFIYALRLMPLADAIALAISTPIFITALAPSMLGERVGWRRWSAVLSGFAGILLILRPTGDVVQWAALIALGATILTAFRDVLTRRMTLTESSVSMVFYSTLAVTLSGSVSAPFDWRSMDRIDLSMLAGAGVILGIAHYLAIEAFRLTEAALVAPFSYMLMPWAVLFGFLIWGDVPDLWVAAGSTLIVGSGLYILRSEGWRGAAPPPVLWMLDGSRRGRVWRGEVRAEEGRRRPRRAARARESEIQGRP